MTYNQSQEVSYPDYDSLPLNHAAGKKSATGVWDRGGQRDHLGSLNHLTPSARLAAVKEVTHGQSVQLDWAWHKIGKPGFGRQPFEHKLLPSGEVGKSIHIDDMVSFNTQTGSQWDGFLHYPDQITGEFYNGVQYSENLAEVPDCHSIDAWCKEGIVGRGVLLDWTRWLKETSQESISALSGHGITFQDLEAIAKHQGVQFQPGDILVVRVGYILWYNSASADERAKFFSNVALTGVAQGEETQRWLWNNKFSAVVSDSPGFECYPPKAQPILHNWLLPHAGIPIGELWDLESLGEVCARLNRWTFLLTSAPMNVRGGVASPPNAIALF